MFTVGTCVSCHKLQGVGQEFGPDLTKLDPKTFKDATDVLRHILEPSLKIDDKQIGARREYGVALAKTGQTDKAQAQLAMLKTQADACGDACPQAADLKAAQAAVQAALSPAGRVVAEAAMAAVNLDVFHLRTFVFDTALPRANAVAPTEDRGGWHRRRLMEGACAVRFVYALPTG